MFSHHKYHTAAPPAAASGVPVKPIWHFTLSLGTHSLTVAGPTDRPTDGRTDGRLYSPRIDTSFVGPPPRARHEKKNPGDASSLSPSLPCSRAPRQIALDIAEKFQAPSFIPSSEPEPQARPSSFLKGYFLRTLLDGTETNFDRRI